MNKEKLIWGAVLGLTAIVTSNEVRKLIKNINKKFEEKPKTDTHKQEEQKDTQTA